MRALFCCLLGLLFITSQAAAMDDRITESNYEAAFAATILPFWKAGTTRELLGHEGLRLYTWHRLHPKARGQILISHGYRENSLKYRELAYTFYQNGYSVFFVDHRGHGYSGRIGAETRAVDVKNFADYSEDFRLFTLAMPLDPQKPTGLFAHSMGSAIAIDFMEKNPGRIQAAVLSSPLIQPRLRGIPVSAALSLARFLAFTVGPESFPTGRRMAELMTFERSGTHSRVRYEFWKEATNKADLRLLGPTNRWAIQMLAYLPQLMQAERLAQLQIPIFLARAGEDKLVDAEAIELFCRKAPNCQLHDYAGSAHEIWNEEDQIRNGYLDDILQYYQRMETKE